MRTLFRPPFQYGLSVALALTGFLVLFPCLSCDKDDGPTGPEHFQRTALLVLDGRSGHPGLLEGANPADTSAFVMRFVGRIHFYATDGLEIHETNAAPLTLEQMLEYEAILWSFNGGGSSLGDHQEDLSAYLHAGGKLFLFGGRMVTNLIESGGGTDYPMLPPQAGPEDADFTEGSFVWEGLHIRSSVVGIDGFNCYSVPPYDHQTWRDGLAQCVPRNPAYPTLVLDPARWNPERPEDCGGSQIRPPRGGIRQWEGVLFDGGYPPHPAEQGLDTLYTAVCYDWAGSAASTWHGSVVAQRYESTAADSLQGTPQGRTIVFLFEPYWFQEEAVLQAGSAAIDWLMTGEDP